MPHSVAVSLYCYCCESPCYCYRSAPAPAALLAAAAVAGLVRVCGTLDKNRFAYKMFYIAHTHTHMHTRPQQHTSRCMWRRIRPQGSRPRLPVCLSLSLSLSAWMFLSLSLSLSRAACLHVNMSVNLYIPLYITAPQMSCCCFCCQKFSVNALARSAAAQGPLPAKGQPCTKGTWVQGNTSVREQEYIYLVGAWQT